MSFEYSPTREPLFRPFINYRIASDRWNSGSEKTLKYFELSNILAAKDGASLLIFWSRARPEDSESYWIRSEQFSSCDLKLPRRA